MEEIRKTKFYPTFAFLGYVIGCLNIYLFFLLSTRGRFSVFFYFIFLLGVVLMSFLLSSLTYMYLEMQKKNSINGNEIFLFYGESLYASLFLIPLAYLRISKFIGDVGSVLVFLLIIISIWLWRIILIKRKTQISFINAFVAAFFPHMFFMTAILVGLFFLIFLVYVFL